MRTPMGGRFDGQIDGKGTVTGRATSRCSYQVEGLVNLCVARARSQECNNVSPVHTFGYRSMRFSSPGRCTSLVAYDDGVRRQISGVSADVSKTGRERSERCPREHVPDTLTITNGTVHSARRDRWTGTVGPQGSVTLRNRRAMRVDAQIDPQGTIKGQYGGPACTVAFVWRKQPG